MTLAEMKRNLSETVMMYNFGELNYYFAKILLDEMEKQWGIRSFAKARQIARMGYIFKNEHKTSEELAIDLNVSTQTIYRLRQKMGYKFENGGDRRSSSFKAQSKTFEQKRLKVIEQIFKDESAPNWLIAKRANVSHPTVVSCRKRLGYKYKNGKWALE